MNYLTLAAIVCGACVLTGSKVYADSMVAPDDYIEACTVMSQRIVLIDIKAVKFKTIELNKGIETRDVAVEASIVETLRGDDKGPEFVDTTREVIISDMDEAKRSHAAAVIDPFLRHSGVHQPSSCTAGHRYLAVFLFKAKFFIEVSRDSDEWRKQVQKYRD